MINKKNFIDLIQTKVNEATGAEYSKKVCGDFLDAVVDAVTEVLTTGESVRIDGIGTFDTIFKAGREGVSAFNGEKWKSDDTIVPRIKFSKSLKDAVGDTYDEKKHKPKK